MYFNFIFISTTDFCIAKGMRSLDVWRHKTFLYKDSLRLQKNAYLLKIKRSSEFSILFTHLLVFDTKKQIKILQLTKVKSHLNGCWENSFLRFF